ncbi:MAG: metal ABC transporter permease [bacterium]
MLELLALPFFQRALIIGLLLAALMAVLGVIIVLRRMSFFSDAIGHAALTGIAIGLLLQFNPFISALIYTMFVAVAISGIRLKSRLSLDSLLGVFFAASVALGVIIVQFTPGYQANLISFLFGDILTVGSFDVILTIIVVAAGAITMLLAGKTFITIAFDPSLAKAEGTAINLYELVFLLVLAAVIALSIKFIGVILVTAMLIIPAASAHNIARTLTDMFVISVSISLISVIIGMLLSAVLATASGPTIVLASTVFFALSLLIRPLAKT